MYMFMKELMRCFVHECIVYSEYNLNFLKIYFNHVFRPQDTGMKNGYSDQPHQQRQSLAERRGSKEFQIDIEAAKMFHPSDPHPSSQPLKMDFFNESPEEKTPNMLNDTFNNAGALEKSPSPIHMDGGASNEQALNRASLEVCQNIHYEKVSSNGGVVNEQAV